MDHPLGLFDSGIGGLTVLRNALDQLPHEDFVYLGDTARLPYGDKSPQTIVRFSIQNAEFLAAHHVKLLVVACNTASAYAVDILKKRFTIPIIDVIEPAVKEAAEKTVTGKIAVLGTRATILSQAYPQKMKLCLPTAEIVSVACPLLVPLVEEEYLHHPATMMILKEYLKPIVESDIDTVILGCTHYPLLLPLIQEQLGKKVAIIDSGFACAKKIVEELHEKNLGRSVLKYGTRKYYASDDKEKFQRLGKKFLGIPIESVEPYLLAEEYTAPDHHSKKQ